MKYLALAALFVVSACAQADTSTRQGAPPPPLVMGSVDFGAISNPQPMIFNTPNGTVICQRTGPNSVYCN